MLHAYLQGHWRQAIAKKSPRPALTSFWLLFLLSNWNFLDYHTSPPCVEGDQTSENTQSPRAQTPGAPSHYPGPHWKP